jgi:hypothetical protein
MRFANINCVTVQYKQKGTFPSTLTGHTTLVNNIVAAINAQN